MHQPRVILASQSPRRRELLELVGISHEVEPADLDETPYEAEPATAHSERLARAKAALVAARRPAALVISADTVVEIDGAILGKPVSNDDAREMLRRLSGRTHRVYSAVAIACDDMLDSALEGVSVTFRDLSPTDIDGYIATGEPADKAGAYGIQGFGSTLVDRIDGDFFAVMGLPLRRLVALLERRGYRYNFGPLAKD